MLLTLERRSHVSAVGVRYGSTDATLTWPEIHIAETMNIPRLLYRAELVENKHL